MKKGVPIDNDTLKNNGKDAERETIRRLNDEITRLREDKKKLVTQFVEMGFLKDENERLRESLKKLQSGRPNFGR